MRKLAVISLFLVLFSNSVNFHCFGMRIFTLNGYSDCSNSAKNPVRFNGTLTNISENVYRIAGDITINELIDGPVEVFSFQWLCSIILNLHSN